MSFFRFVLRFFRKTPQALESQNRAPKRPEKIDHLPDNLRCLAEVLAIFGDEGIECRAFGTRGVFLPLRAAEEVARRIALLSQIETRGYL